MTLIELLVAIVMCVIVSGAAFDALGSITRTQLRDQVYANEVTAAQTAMSRLLHDLRQATTVLAAQPNRIEFLMPSAQVVAGQRTLVTLDVRYDCTVSDSLTGYKRCARTQAVSGTILPTPASTPGSGDIEHVANGSISTYCASDGSAQSGSVFFYGNPTTKNTDSTSVACDENYENLVAQRPSYVQVLVRVPASGSLTSGGLHHQTVLSDSTYLRNWNLGA